MKKLWEKIKKWFNTTTLPWLKISWLQIVNVFIVLAAYGALDNAGSSATWYVGLWGFILLGYWIFWKFLGVDKMLKPKKKKK